MLQKYPDMVEKVHLVINLAGFVHKSDLKLSNWQKKELRVYAKTFSYHTSSRLYRTVAYEEFFFRRIYKLRNKKTKDLAPKESKRLMKSELSSQKKTDTRSHMFTLNELSKLDNTKVPVRLPVWSLVGTYDEYLYSDRVKSHLEAVYSKYHEIKFKKNTHKVASNQMTPEYINQLIPYKLKVLLNRQNKRKR
jgi:hypothetical protein